MKFFYTVCFCVLYHSHNKQWLCPWTPLNGWSLQWLQTVFSVSRNWSFIYNGDVCQSSKGSNCCLSFFFPLSISWEQAVCFKAIWREAIFYDSCIFTTMQTTVISRQKSKHSNQRMTQKLQSIVESIHVYYSTMQKQMIQCMKLSQPCWLKLKYYVMWCLVGQSLVTDDLQEIITSTLKIVFLDCPEDAVSRIVWNITNYRPIDIVSYTRLL